MEKIKFIKHVEDSVSEKFEYLVGIAIKEMQEKNKNINVEIKYSSCINLDEIIFSALIIGKTIYN